MSMIFYYVFCALVAYVLLQLLVVYPRWKEYRLQKAFTGLSRSISYFNDHPLPNGIIGNGDYLHDRFYKTMLKFCCVENKFSIKVSSIKYTQDDEDRIKKFRLEVNQLDDKTRTFVDLGTYSMGAIIMILNPIKFFLVLIKTEISSVRFKELKREELKKQVKRSGEYIAVRDERGPDIDLGQYHTV